MAKILEIEIRIISLVCESFQAGNPVGLTVRRSRIVQVLA